MCLIRHFVFFGFTLMLGCLSLKNSLYIRAFWTSPNAATLAVDCQKSRNSSTLKTRSHLKDLADFHLDFLLEVPVRIPSLPACNGRR